MDSPDEIRKFEVNFMNELYGNFMNTVPYSQYLRQYEDIREPLTKLRKLLEKLIRSKFTSLIYKEFKS